MVARVAYNFEQHRHAEACLLAIRLRLERGWELVSLRGGTGGPFVALYRKSDPS
ncbi:MAG: hypothetical protein ACKVVT_09500 [Dehalococcoidia bacterium]